MISPPVAPRSVDTASRSSKADGASSRGSRWYAEARRSRLHRERSSFGEQERSQSHVLPRAFAVAARATCNEGFEPLAWRWCGSSADASPSSTRARSTSPMPMRGWRTATLRRACRVLRCLRERTRAAAATEQSFPSARGRSPERRATSRAATTSTHARAVSSEPATRTEAPTGSPPATPCSIRPHTKIPHA